MTINRRFEVLFPERRPFFLENAATFETPLPLFFSRRIANPQVGARFSGIQNGWTIGALVVDDHVPTPNESRYFEAPFEDRAWNTVLRVQRQLTSQSTLGALLTHRWSVIGSNTVLALDGRSRLNKNWVAGGQLAYGLLNEVGGESEQGHAFLGTIRRSGRYFTYSGLFRDLNDQFRANLSSIQRQRLGTRRMQHEVDFRIWPVWGPLINLGPTLEYRVDADSNWGTEERNIESGFRINLRGSTRIAATYDQTFERYRDIDFNRHQTRLSFETQAMKKLALEGSVMWGTDINRRPTGATAPFLADEKGSNLELFFRPKPRLRYEISHRFRHLSHLGPQNEGSRIYNLHIVRTGVHVQVTGPLSFRLLVDTQLFRVNPDFYADELESSVGFDALITYRANAFSAIYFGFTDRYENLPDPASPFFNFDQINQSTWPTTSTARQFFLKISYLIGR